MRFVILGLLTACRTGELVESTVSAELADLTARVEAMESTQANAAATDSQHADVISENTLSIEELEAQNSSLAEDVAALSGDIDLSDLEVQVSTNTTDIAIVDAQVTNIEDDISGLTTEQTAQVVALALVSADVTTHSTDIASLQTTTAATAVDLALIQNQSTSSAAGIVQLTADLATNTTGISANATTLTSHTTDISNNAALIATNTADNAAQTSDIATNTGAISTTISGIALLSTDVQTQSSDLANNTSDINALNDSIVALEDEMACPTDMVDAGGFCIDIDQNTTNSWQSQANTCHAEGKRLCSMAEWLGSCNDASSLGLNNMLSGNFEYVDEYWVMNYTNGQYYSAYVSLGATECGRIYYSGWACAGGNCYDTTNEGGSYPSRCCL